MSNFKFPLAIEGTKDQLLALVPKLEELGYEKVPSYKGEDYQRALVTCFSNVNAQISLVSCVENWSTVSGTGKERTIISASNPDLVLALSAMREGEEVYKGEYSICLEAYTDKTYGDVNIGDLVQARIDGANVISNYRKATKEEIIQHFNKTTMKIIGYELIKEYPGSPSLATRVVDFPLDFKNYPEFWKPLFEEDDKKKVFTLSCKDGSFEIEVSKKGIYYAPDKAWLDVGDIRQVMDFRKEVRKSGSCYSFYPSHINSGCKVSVPRGDWEKVLDYYDSLTLPF